MEVSAVFRILGLGFATEAVYSIPFQLPGIYRPIFLKALGLTSEDVGVVQSMYGIVNLLLYLPGGYLADRFQPRILMSCALLTSAACSVCLLRADSLDFRVASLSTIWALFAISGNLLYWSPHVASIRQVAGRHSGFGFGLEQCSRGVIASLISTVLLTWLGTTSESQESLSQTRSQYHSLVAAYICILILATVVLLFAAPTHGFSDDAAGWRDDSAYASEGTSLRSSANSSSHMSSLYCSRSVWLMALVVLAAYTGNLATGFFAGMAHDVYGMSNVEAGRIGTIAFVVRAIAPGLAGASADRFGRKETVSYLFAGLVLSYVWFALMPMEPHLRTWLPLQASCASAFAFGLTAVYFTLLDDFELPQEQTGAVVGIVSAIGFLPDIFVAPVAGYFLDHYSGQHGYRLFTFSVASVGLVGLFATILLPGRTPRGGQSDTASDAPEGRPTIYGNGTELTPEPRRRCVRS